MAVKVYIGLKGEAKSGSYEIESFPPTFQGGFLQAKRIVKKDGSRKPVLIGQDSIARIEMADGINGEPDYEGMPE